VDPRGKAPTPGSFYPVAVVLLVLAGFVALAILPRILEGSHPLVGRPVPTMTLPLLSGVAPPAGSPNQPVDLASLRGKVVVLDFWAPWCGPCRAEMPELDKLSRKLEGEGVTFVGVMVDGDPIHAREVLKNGKIGYLQLEDDGHGASAFNVKTLPSIVIVDRQGTIRAYHSGMWGADEVEAAIRRAM
jgi:thiol-disulfide isomerase/thioredoxin